MQLVGANIRRRRRIAARSGDARIVGRAVCRCAPALIPALRAATTAATWQEREQHLAAAYEHVAEMHNRLGLTEALALELEATGYAQYRDEAA